MSKAVQQRAVFGAVRRPKQFLREVGIELRKVKWPSAHDVWQLTLVVIFTIIAVGIYVAVIDLVLSKFFQLIGMYS